MFFLTLAEADIFPSETLCYYVIAAVIGLIGLVVYKLISSTDEPNVQKYDMDFNNQSVCIDGRPECRGSWFSKPPEYTEMNSDPLEVIKCFYDALQRGKQISNNGPCLGTRTGPGGKYEWMTFQQVIDESKCFGSGLLSLGLKPNNDTYVGIIANNRYEWIVASYGVNFYSMVTIPINTRLDREGCIHIINQGEIEVVIVQSHDRVIQLLHDKTETPSFRVIIMMDEVPVGIKEAAQCHGIEIYSFSQVVEMGRRNIKEMVQPKVEDVFSIMHTSGTTGLPKGVMITMRSFILMIRVMERHMQRCNIHFSPDDTHISYLPLVQVFDRSMHILMHYNGGRVGYWSGDFKTLRDDLVELKPTFFASESRLFVRMRDEAINDVSGSWFKSTLFKWALACKQKDIDRGIYRRDTICDKLVMKKIRDKLGGKVRLIMSGAAPLSEKVINFLRCSLGCLVIEGYGQTEATVGHTCTLPFDNAVDYVGPPMEGVQIKLVDVPELGLFACDGVGEICAKSESLLFGYFKEPKKTAESMDENGWLHTGDIGTWLPNGALKIIDRKNHLFKLSQGEYIAPQRIEFVYKECPFVMQCYLNGDSTKDKPVAVIVPEQEKIAQWAPKNGFPVGLKEICHNTTFKNIVLKEMIAHGAKRQLKGFQQVKDILLEWEPWTVENGLLTPTFKNRRPQLNDKYWKIMKQLYPSSHQAIKSRNQHTSSF